MQRRDFFRTITALALASRYVPRSRTPDKLEDPKPIDLEPSVEFIPDRNGSIRLNDKGYRVEWKNQPSSSRARGMIETGIDLIMDRQRADNGYHGRITVKRNY